MHPSVKNKMNLDNLIIRTEPNNTAYTLYDSSILNRNSNDIKIWVYVLNYNEMKLIPFCINYWKRFADKVIVYDNESTDGSIEYLSQFDWIEVRSFKMDKVDENITRDIKNSVWKEAKQFGVNFVMVCDMDEVIYSKYDIKEILSQHLNDDIYASNWFDLYAEKFPSFNENYLLHQTQGVKGLRRGHPQHNIWSEYKFLLFNAQTISESNYVEGGHKTNFKKIDNSALKTFIDDNIYIFHLQQVGIDFVTERFHRNYMKNSALNISKGWCSHWNKTASQIRENILNKLQNSVTIE